VNPFNRLKRYCGKAPGENPSAKILRKFSARFLALVICGWLISVNAQAAPGDLDPTFGIGGVTVYPGMNLNYPAGIAVQPDGKILVGGSGQNGIIFSNQRLAVARYLPNGVLDASFGQNGVAFSSFTGYELIPSDMALLPNGKIVMIGRNRTPLHDVPGISTSDMIVAVFDSQGVEERTFAAHPGSGLHSRADAITVQPDGKFVIVGSTGGGYKTIIPTKQVVMRMTPDVVNSDPSFNTVLNPNAGEAQSVALQPDGKIVVGSGRALTRYNSNGLLDTAFGNRGTIVAPAPTTQTLEGISLAAQPDGKIIGAAMINEGTNADFAVFRFNYNGSPDLGFGTNGLVTTAVTSGLDRVADVVLQPNGKILVFGSSSDGANVQRTAIVRYQPNGALDTTFGTGGIVTAPNEWFYPSDGTLQWDGKILSTGGFRVVRYLNDAPLAPRAANFDFDGDGQADFAVTRNIDANQNWYAVKNPSFALLIETEWGLTTDKIVPADYDGDRKTDLAVFRPSDGNWYILKSASSSISTVQFGQTGDVPAPSDYDGDGRADTAVFRAGNWYILNSSNNGFRAERFGVAGDKPLMADFDGDGRADLAVYRGGAWYAQCSTTGFFAADFGIAGDVPMPADYDGDGKTDLAVYRDGTWYLQNSAEGFKAFQFGQPGDKLVPADYDADGKTNIAVFRSGVWYILGAAGDLRVVYFGDADDRPVSTAFQP
jgi:uncharacterized delta-60 repeat protein